MIKLKGLINIPPIAIAILSLQLLLMGWICLVSLMTEMHFTKSKRKKIRKITNCS